MGRARGSVEPTAAPARRDSASSAGSVTGPAPARSPAEVLGLAPNPHRVPTPQEAPMFTVRGVALYRADSTDPALPVPTCVVQGVPTYPQTPRAGKARLDGELWQRMVRAGNVYRVGDLCATLWRAGVGTRALGGKGADKPLSQERLREEFHALCWEGLVPGGSDVLLPTGERGFGVCRSRQEATRYAEHRRSRSRSQRSSLVALARRAPLWFAASEDDRASWAVPGQPMQRLTPVLGAMSTGEWRTNRELADAVWGDELRSSGLAGDQLDRALRGKASGIRDLLHDARAAGVPVLGSPAHGYRLAEHVGELHGYFEAEKLRMDAVEAGAARVEKAAALWWPETATERETARRWRSTVQRSKTAPQTLRREQQRRDREQAAEHDRQTVRGHAAQREAELMATPEWAQLRVKRAAGLPEHALTPAERALVRELTQQRRAKKTGRAPGERKKPATGDSPPRRATSEVEPPPW